MPQIKTLILRAPGANCDEETQFAFQQAGAVADRVHINRLRENPALLDQYQILAVPGGFTYGDDIAAGRILANQLRSFFADRLHEFREKGNLILGICNGFQALLRAGLLLPPRENVGIPATLARNQNRKFEDRWVHLKPASDKCPFLVGIDILEAPVAHGEGRFVAVDDDGSQELLRNEQVALRYVDAQGRSGPFPVNPNGSHGDIAGICDSTGRVLGLMPHPERNVLPTHHPNWTRRNGSPNENGLRFFQNAVNYFRR